MKSYDVVIKGELYFKYSSIRNIVSKVCVYMQWVQTSHSIASKFFLVAKAGDELWLFFNFWISKGKKSPFILRSFISCIRIASGPCIRPHCGSAASQNAQCLHVSMYQIPAGIRAASCVGCCTNCCWLLFCISHFSLPWHYFTLQFNLWCLLTSYCCCMSAGWGLAL